MPDVLDGVGELRFDKSRNAFVGRVQIAPMEYRLEARPYEDGAGVAWRLHVLDGRPYGPYRLPLVDDA